MRDLLLDNPNEEMGELIDSEPECYKASSENNDQGVARNDPSAFNDDLDSDESKVLHRQNEALFNSDSD